MSDIELIPESPIEYNGDDTMYCCYEENVEVPELPDWDVEPDPDPTLFKIPIVEPECEPEPEPEQEPEHNEPLLLPKIIIPDDDSVPVVLAPVLIAKVVRKPHKKPAKPYQRIRDLPLDIQMVRKLNMKIGKTTDPEELRQHITKYTNRELQLLASGARKQNEAVLLNIIENEITIRNLDKKFTKEDDKRLLKLVRDIGKHWETIGKLMKRTDIQCKNRYETLERQFE